MNEQRKNKKVRLSYNKCLKAIGFYDNINQKMNPEVFLTDDAAVLADKLKKSVEGFYPDQEVKEKGIDIYAEKIDSGNFGYDFIEMSRSAFVIIFRDVEYNLYAYFPKDGTVKITNVKYNPEEINIMPRCFRGWFKPGELFMAKTDVEDEPSIIY